MSKRRRPRGSGSLFKRTPKGPWIAAWRDGNGDRREKNTATTDKATAERILAKLTGDAALRRDGIIDSAADRYSEQDRRPIDEHLTDWETSLTAKGVSDRQVRLVTGRATRILEEARVTRLSAVTSSAIQAAIGDLVSEDNLSLQTAQHHVRAIKQFSRWLRRDRRTREDALDGLSGFSAETDRRYLRRPLSSDELATLIATTRKAAAWRGISGEDRAIAYATAAGTGFRVGELRSLTRASFHLDDDPPAVVLEARNSKRRREDRQPISPALAEGLRPWLADRPSRKPVFAALPERTAEMIRRDLRHARAVWLAGIRRGSRRAEQRAALRSEFLRDRDSAGRVADFHALRGSYITALIRAGVSVKEAQELARHSDPKLTMNVYARLGMVDLGGAVARLPSPLMTAAPKPNHPENKAVAS